MLGTSQLCEEGRLAVAVPVRVRVPTITRTFRSSFRRRFVRMLHESTGSLTEIRRLRAQLEALNLAGRGLRQLGAEFDPARIFVGGELEPAVILQGLSGLFTRRGLPLEHHEG